MTARVRPTTVLLVDDEDEVREILALMLEKGGFRVLQADSGARALELYAQSGPDIDVVVLDLLMPVMKGSEVFDRLVATDATVRVLFLSGYNSSRALTGLSERPQFCGLLLKPVTFAQLNERVRAVATAPLRALPEGDATEEVMVGAASVEERATDSP